MPLYLATCRPLPEPDDDEGILLATLAMVGVDARLVAWNRDPPPVDGPVVLRSTWDYHHHLDDFLAWCAAVPRLHNALPLVQWSARKSYLLDLAAAGVPVVPTLLLRRDERVSLQRACDALGWTDVVVKPAVGAASWGAVRGAPLQVEAHAQSLRRSRDVLVQPYMPAVAGPGERAVVWLGGEITHAVRKSPRLSDEAESVSAALEVAEDERAVALRAMAVATACTGAVPLYGRVDLVRDAEGQPRVMELELVEPSLFLAQHPPALARFAVLLARLGS